MNLDMTFCTGLRCGRAKDCYRWIENLEARLDWHNIDLQNKPITMAQYADYDGKCVMFMAILDIQYD
jgi:hypothetical protein